VVSIRVRGARGMFSAPMLVPVMGFAVSLRPFSTPSSPAASTAATARYGFMSAPGQRVSSRVDFGDPEITRKEAVRLSTPHVGFTGAQNPSTRRLYELIVGQYIGAISMSAPTCPAR